jgi:enamine deaminase RidA (YjgF/YER057c/UK114 family)
MPYATNPIDEVRTFFEDSGGGGPPVLVYPGFTDPLEYAKIHRIAQSRAASGKPVKFGTCSAQVLAFFLDSHTDRYDLEDKKQLIWDMATAMNTELRQLAHEPAHAPLQDVARLVEDVDLQIRRGARRQALDLAPERHQIEGVAAGEVVEEDAADAARLAAVVDSPGRLVFTAGACPLDAQGRTVAVGDYAGQARVVMENLRVALQDAGADLADVVKSTVYVASTDRRDLVASWEVVRDAFGDHDPPSTLLGVAMLGYADQLVEVEAVAAVSA